MCVVTIQDSSDAIVEMNEAEKTQEEARKCGDLLLITEVILEIVNEYNHKSVFPLDVRIGTLSVCDHGYIVTPCLFLSLSFSLSLSLSLSLSHTHTPHTTGIGTGSTVSMFGDLTMRFSV